MASALSSSGKKSSVDLSEGPVLRRIAAFAMPLLLGQILQNLYNSVDSIVAGNCLGVTALAAVTSCADIARLLTGFFTGLSVGSGVVFARYFGAKDEKRLHTSIHTALTFAVLLGVTMMTAGILLSPLLLRLVKCTEEVYPEALIYLRIYLVGILFTSIYNVEASVLRSVGDSRTPFLILAVTSCTNIALDLVFTVAVPLGVTGIALATILSQLLSVALVTRKMLRARDVYRLVPRDLTVSPQFLGEIIRLGIPAAIQSGLISFSNLFVQRYINVFGTAAMAGTGVGKKIDAYIGLISSSFGQSTTTFVSQCMGAGKRARAKEGIRKVLLLNAVLVVLTSVPMLLFADRVAALFTSDPDAISYAVLMVRLLMPLYAFQMLHQIFSSTIRGFGRSAVAMLTAMSGIIFFRQIYLAVITRIFDTINVVYLGWPIGWLVSFLSAFIYYLVAIRHLLKDPVGVIPDAR